MAVYIETSALAKRYVNERTSPQFEAFLQQQGDEPVITPLTSTEFASVLARRVRLRELSAAAARRVQQLFSAELARAVWAVQPFRRRPSARPHA